jgi:hypothetical protein
LPITAGTGLAYAPLDVAYWHHVVAMAPRAISSSALRRR